RNIGESEKGRKIHSFLFKYTEYCAKSKFCVELCANVRLVWKWLQKGYNPGILDKKRVRLENLTLFKY
ncbi:hypothetical protein ACFL4N_03555, partial [Thermodesulfobacteriota bacterium]